MTPRRVAFVQGLYYLGSGIWPLVSMRTFQAVTGPKTDDWLVRTVGLLAATIGGVLAGRALPADPDVPPDPTLGIGSALAFATTDVVHALSGRISRVYLADAAVELGIVAAWVAALHRRDEPAAALPAPARPSAR
jgi:hypothetical protein